MSRFPKRGHEPPQKAPKAAATTRSARRRSKTTSPGVWPLIASASSSSAGFPRGRHVRLAKSKLSGQVTWSVKASRTTVLARPRGKSTLLVRHASLLGPAFSKTQQRRLGEKKKKIAVTVLAQQQKTTTPSVWCALHKQRWTRKIETLGLQIAPSRSAEGSGLWLCSRHSHYGQSPIYGTHLISPRVIAALKQSPCG